MAPTQPLELPAELISLIVHNLKGPRHLLFTHLREERADLVACSQLSRLWNQETVPVLFERTYIELKDSSTHLRDRVTKFLELLASRSDLAHYIRHLEIVFNLCWTDCLIPSHSVGPEEMQYWRTLNPLLHRFYLSLTQLREVVFRDPYRRCGTGRAFGRVEANDAVRLLSGLPTVRMIEDQTGFPLALWNSNPNITHFTTRSLLNRQFPFQHDSDVVSLPVKDHVRSYDAADEEINEQEAVEGGAHTAQRKASYSVLECLAIECTDQCDLEMLDADLPMLSDLRQLKLAGARARNLRPVQKLLRTVQETLEGVDIDLCLPSVDRCVLDFQPMSNLRFLTMAYTYVDIVGDLPDLMETFTALTPSSNPNLESVSIFILTICINLRNYPGHPFGHVGSTALPVNQVAQDNAGDSRPRTNAVTPSSENTDPKVLAFTQQLLHHFSTQFVSKPFQRLIVNHSNKCYDYNTPCSISPRPGTDQHGDLEEPPAPQDQREDSARTRSPFRANIDTCKNHNRERVCTMLFREDADITGW